MFSISAKHAVRSHVTNKWAHYLAMWRSNVSCSAVYCFGSSADVGLALRRKLLLLGIPFTAMSLQEAAAQAAGHGSQGSGSGSSNSRGGGGSGAAAAGGPQLYLAPAQLENSLNRLFEGGLLLSGCWQNFTEPQC
jgi:hypothetical protein